LWLWHEFAEPTIGRPASVPCPCGSSPAASGQSSSLPCLMDKVRVPLPWAVSVCEPTLVVVQVSKAYTWLLARVGCWRRTTAAAPEMTAAA
jgi:hypothetical protein